LLVAGALAACSKSAPPRQTAVSHVPVVTASTGTISPKTTLGGLIVPLQNVAIQTSLVEPTAAVYVREGDHVHRGEVLAQLDVTDLQAQLRALLATAASDRAKASQTYDQAGLTILQNSNSVHAQQATLAQAQAALSRDTLDLSRDAQLLKNGYISQQQFDTQNTLVKSDREAVRSAQVALQNQVAQVRANGTTSSGLQGATVASALADEQTAIAQADNLRAEIARATIVSPIDGVVVNRYLNPGEYPGNRQIFTLQQTDHVYAVLNGSGSQVLGVAKNALAQITSTDRVTLHAPGRVDGVLDSVNPGSTNFIVKVLLDNAAGAFHPGMVVSGTIAKPRSSGLRIPVTAFLDDTHSTVQIVENGVVKTQSVTAIADDGKNAIVQGIEPGLQVVANGQLGLSDNQKVEAQPQKVAER
jgi:multidrug efflux pump subunit AcrA (membrane-fusion protein)